MGLFSNIFGAATKAAGREVKKAAKRQVKRVVKNLRAPKPAAMKVVKRRKPKKLPKMRSL